MSDSKFRVGDPVRVRAHCTYAGLTGKVTQILSYGDGEVVEVLDAEGDRASWQASSLELDSSSTTEKLVVRQLLLAPFQNVGGPLTYSVLALSEQGGVYRYDPKCRGWLPWSMDVARCGDDHAGAR